MHCSRFCGPATTVDIFCITVPRLELRTEGQAVSETGERVARLVLFPEQVELLNLSPLRVFLSGPPGTGKTIMLILQGLNCLQRDYDVRVVSMWPKSRAVSIVIEQQVLKSASAHLRGRLKRCTFEFVHDRDVQSAVRLLARFQNNLCILADEAGPKDRLVMAIALSYGYYG